MPTTLVPLVLGGLLLALPAQAQQPGQRPMHQPGVQCGMGLVQNMRGVMAGPMMILYPREALELTAERAQQVDVFHARVQPEVRQSMQQAMEMHHQAMDALTGATPDPERHDILLRQAADQMVSAHSQVARGMVEAQQVLTPERREDLRFAVRAVRSMMRGGQGMGPEMIHPRPGMLPIRPEEGAGSPVPEPTGGSMRIRTLYPSLAVLMTGLIGCGGEADEEPATVEMMDRPRAEAAHDTFPAEMQQFHRHLQQMDAVDADSFRAMLPMHRQMLSGTMGRMRGMPMMMDDPQWNALMDSLHQDTTMLSGGLSGMSAEQVEEWMGAHRTRAMRMMERHAGMRGNMP